ncbi:hypothetical protein BP5796_01624 [Coleophoma crateriformis]|uniref:Uncharacterized protein n=1 Tax=Coleophoma crateriformis TaxID=565419 RepID=A0A3D8T127_9HELO|nr:hypothetical protein BP5796_01624 [Coleophoma crateriformis]
MPRPEEISQLRATSSVSAQETNLQHSAVELSTAPKVTSFFTPAPSNYLSRSLSSASSTSVPYSETESPRPPEIAPSQSPYEDEGSGVWIMNQMWLTDSSTLSEAETIFSQSKYQSGRPSAHNQNCQQPTRRVISQTINAYLLRSCAFLACSLPGRGLASAEEAMQLATEYQIFEKICKSQLYTGLCLMELERWKEASRAF